MSQRHTNPSGIWILGNDRNLLSHPPSFCILFSLLIIELVKKWSFVKIRDFGRTTHIEVNGDYETKPIVCISLIFCIFCCSLDSEFLATTSTDGSARIWKAEDGFPLSTLERGGVRNSESYSLHFSSLYFQIDNSFVISCER